MSDETKITLHRAAARFGVALSALGDEPGEDELTDNSLRAGRQVVLALQMALIKAGDEREAVKTPAPPKPE